MKFSVLAQEKTVVVTIDGYQNVVQNESALLCAVVQQPVSVGIDGSSLDFQLYTGVRPPILSIYFIVAYIVHQN